ncbi:hypothetical protein [Streptomyces sp. NPDC002491]
MPATAARLQVRRITARILAGAPLLAGDNVATMSTETRDVLTDPEALAVDQDPRGDCTGGANQKWTLN